MYKYLVAALSILLCCGCMTTGKKPSAYDPARDVSPIELPTEHLSIPLKMENLPVDVALSMSGIVHLIRGEHPDVPNLQIGPDISVAEPGFPLRSLDFIALTILDRSEKEILRNKQWETVTTAVLTFGAGPFKAGMLTRAECTVTRSGVTLTKARSFPLSAAQPRVLGWFVPKKAFLEGMKTLPAQTPWEIMALVGSMGVQVGKNLPPATGEYLAVAIVVDRLEATDDIKGGICADAYPFSRWKTTAQAYSMQGWPILIADVGVPLNVPEQERFMHVIWTSSDLSRTNGKKLDVPIGRFSSCGTVFQTADRKNLGPLESGARFLNPGNPDDARRIQARLENLGMYKGAIDGIFGKGSKAALKQFRTSRGLGTNANWNLPTQKLLFSGSGE